MVVNKKRTLERKSCKCEFLSSRSFADVLDTMLVCEKYIFISLGLYLLLCFATAWFFIRSMVLSETLCPLLILSSRFTHSLRVVYVIWGIYVLLCARLWNKKDYFKFTRQSLPPPICVIKKWNLNNTRRWLRTGRFQN